MLSSISPLTDFYIINLQIASIVLLAGCLLAWVIAEQFGRLLQQVNLDQWLTYFMRFTLPLEQRLNAAAWIVRFIFYFIIFISLIVFLQLLGAARAAEPLLLLLSRFIHFLPQLATAALFLVIAWLLSFALRYAAITALRAARADDQVQDFVREGQPVETSASLPNAIYWLVFLLFSPIIFYVLGLDSILSPVENAAEGALRVLPNLFTASLLLIAGWFGARLLSRLIANVLRSAGIDRLGMNIGLPYGRHQISDLVGFIANFLLLIPVLTGALTALRLDAVTVPVLNVLQRSVDVLPSVSTALLLLAIAFVIGRLASKLVQQTTQIIGFDQLPSRLGIGFVQESPLVHLRSPSEIAGSFVFIWIMLHASIEAARIAGFRTLAELLPDFTLFLGQIIVIIAAAGLAAYVAHLVVHFILSSHTAQGRLIASVVRFVIVILVIAFVFQHFGIVNDAVSIASRLLLGAGAVAAALAFGFGGRSLTVRLLNDWRRT